MDGSRLLIFMETKRGCDQVTRQLRMDGWPALSIHGDKSQAERDWVLSEFKTGKSPIMTATDVAARGLGMFRKAFSLKHCVLISWNEVIHAPPMRGGSFSIRLRFVISFVAFDCARDRTWYRISMAPHTCGKFWVSSAQRVLRTWFA